MKRVFSALIAIAFAAIAANAQENPTWLRNNAISPDGKTIAFSYKGDIYTVPAAGGVAKQITTNKAYETDPLWTPDGTKLVFSSEREGSKDIYITGREGGTPTRITNYPGRETPKAVLADGTIIFVANIQPDSNYGGFPGDPQVYSVKDIKTAPKLLTSITFNELSINKDGLFLYEDDKGYEDPLRKHHTSSVTRDIWVADLSAQKYTKLSTYEGEDRQPVFGPDGDTFYFLSERGGSTINLFKSSLSAPGKAEQLTKYTKNPVRYISVAADGTIAFSYNGDLYTMKEGTEPRKVDITVYRDDDDRDMHKLIFSGGARDIAASPDGKEFALAIRGDIFVTSADYTTTKRITNTPEQERNVSFSKDGRTLYYSAERNGCWSIYKSSLKDKKDKLFTYATSFKEELFSLPGETSFQPMVSPDGKWVAYLRDRTELVIKSTKRNEIKSLLKGANYSYSDGDIDFAWSPDSQYLLSNYDADGGWHNSDIALIDINTGAVTDLTNSGYSDVNFKWALGGKAMTWESDKMGYRSHGSWGAQSDIYVMFFDAKEKAKFLRDKEDIDLDKMNNPEKKKNPKDTSSAKEKKVEKLELNLIDREYRIIRLTNSSGNYGDYYLTPDGEKLYYTTPLESGFGLCVKDIKDGSIKVLKRGVRGSLVPSADEKTLYVFSSSGITRITLASGSMKDVKFSGEFEFRPKEERAYIFEHVWKQVKEKFYDPEIHGIDWAYYHDNYARFLDNIGTFQDFREMLSEMLGELNGSHTGARYRPGGGVALGHLGVIYDLNYSGEGLRIKEVLPDGVLAVADYEIKAGDIITAIDGVKIEANANWMTLLSGKAGKKTLVSVDKKNGKNVDLLVKPVSSESDLLYRRWVRQREEMVYALSGGKVGYVHVQGMNSPSFREVYSKALGKYRNCEALIVDTRHNGGGWLHDDLATFLNGKAYLEFKPRGQYIGTEPFNKWTKPSCVLMCEDNYSDACGFPYTYRSLGLGKLIGAPVPGTMTAVWWETQVNGTIIFGIPQVGSWGIKEQRYLENMQIEPDILVYNSPESLLAGEDKQLEAAVKEMLSQIEK